MKRRKSNFTPNVDGLENRQVLSTVPTPLSQLASGAAYAMSVHRNVAINRAIPYVLAPPGVNQFAINFTSNTFHQIMNGLNSAAQSFARYGSTAHLQMSLSSLAHRVPYGSQLLATWYNDLANFGLTVNPLGGASPAIAGVSGSTVGAALHQLQADLLNYLDQGVGSSFNILKSGVNWSTDHLLIYNGRVGQGPAHHQAVVTGTTPVLT